jgi:glucosamine kinase
MTRVILGVDAGQSGSRLTLVRPVGAEVSWAADGVPAGMTPAQAMSGPLLDSAVGRLRELGVDEVHAVGAGVTGFHAGAQHAPEVLAAWRRCLGVRRLVLADDAVTSYLGALGARPGAVVAAGTGVTALATDGRASVRVNGWGPTLGDEGGGYWIGLHGLRSAYRHSDGRGGSAQLEQRARAMFGELPRLPARLAASPERTALVAAFAREVADAACAGDAVATGIWTDAAGELARSALAALTRLEAAPAGGGPARCVSWNGSLFGAGDLLVRPFREAVRAVAPDLEVVTPTSDALGGTVALTRQPDLAQFGALVDTADIE